MPSGVYKRSEAIKANMRIRMIGKKNHLGFKHSEETKLKMSEKAKKRTPWNKGIKATDGHKKKMSDAKKGKPGNRRGVPQSDSAKKKLRIAHLGKKMSIETRKKMGLKKEKNPAWKGGVTPINRLIRVSREYQDWRKSVFERDDYTCQFCGQRGVRLHADHIKPFSLFPELRFELSNGRTLCEPCHKKTPTWGFKALKYEDTGISA